MTEPVEQKAGVKLTGFGSSIELFGGNSLFFFLLLVLGLNIGITLWEHLQRREEHEQIQCGSKLGIYIYTMPKGSPIDWKRMPVDVYKCIPPFLYNRPVLKEE